MKRDVELPGFAATAKFFHRHWALVEVIDWNRRMAEIDGFSHVVGDWSMQIRVAEKGPTAEVDRVDIVIQSGVVGGG